jgi:hypothetical protein
MSPDGIATRRLIIPAQAGIQVLGQSLDARFRGHDSLIAEKARNEKAVKPLRTHDSAKPLIQRS